MNNVTKPGMATDSLAHSANAAGQIGADTIHQMLDRSQAIANALAAFGAETANFVGKRVEHSSEVFGNVAQCRSLPDMLEMEAQWWRKAMDDYTGQINRLVAFNASLVGKLAEAPASKEPKLPVPATGGTAQNKLQAA